MVRKSTRIPNSQQWWHGIRVVRTYIGSLIEMDHPFRFLWPLLPHLEGTQRGCPWGYATWWHNVTPRINHIAVEKNRILAQGRNVWIHTTYTSRKLHFFSGGGKIDIIDLCIHIWNRSNEQQRQRSHFPVHWSQYLAGRVRRGLLLLRLTRIFVRPLFWEGLCLFSSLDV